MIRDIERELAQMRVTIRRTDHGANGPEGRIDCPWCPKRPDAPAGDPALAMNLRSGAWRCHRCQASGGFFAFQQRLLGTGAVVPVGAPKAKTAAKILPDSLVSRMEAALWSSEGNVGLRYLRNRGFTDETIKHFRLGYAKRAVGEVVAIPHFMGGLCVGVKYRALAESAPRKYEREPDCAMPLFGIDTIGPDTGSAILTEGEFDAIALSQVFGLGAAVVSLTEGATAHLKDEARAALVTVNDLLICTDMDPKGDEGAAMHSSDLGAYRCRRVKLPRKDANECLVAGVTREEFEAAFASAESSYATKVKHIRASREDMLAMSGEVERGRPTGWPTMDRILGGFRPGEVTLLTAGTGSGKTSWTIDMTRRQGELRQPSLLASLEMRRKAVAAKLLSVVAGRRWDYMSPQERLPHVDALCEMPIYLLDHYGAVPLTVFRAEVEYAVRRFGVGLVVLDHLHFAIGHAHDDERKAIDAAAYEVQQIALHVGVHVVLVMHPAKIKTDEFGKTREPEIGDLKGSSGPSQFADNVCRISRHPTDGSANLKFLKVRSELATLGSVFYKFDPGTLRFEETAPPGIGAKQPPSEWRRAPND